ncbi:MAG: tRNA (adenosine(37)-N6)-threonylcarbamoyltransferase complex ATPase subunit type 1 TsaE [Bacteroidetes bacterium]|nr:tRNA (adenosine(37)-N6)-threonylcarbamoyltransferase complex ATPase subunit type 1 TsaE [Bacteroidota bacterium]MBP7398252.1 tRNA (adenosine(37)-N6)-threonylcarbamoyltransferase complex ATPase subunit type 1 TsaE [Chitinophagales bacterium]MBK7109788.1 tRNA (adenosine(37)-N6)-threonylcarbamoyltransferase complex ATPase subunit type 1 TsaE [Bacteroidota bacterium]MBK8487477.1 tRNA (adenosine(37)-N6)-threonylcarbamoyltransferase complex ATPase subunit type 1 TsaE [Bacteroidota bacterium]MBK868
MQQQWLVENAEAIDHIAVELLAAANHNKKFAITGVMGAGKTTLIAAICRALKISDQVSSPTFAIVQEYGTEPPVFHFDLYRVKNTQELEDLGFEDYLESPSYIFIEWPEIIMEHLQQQGFKKINIQITAKNKRIINLER